MSLLTHRFFSAVRICISDLTIKQRLLNAWMEYLDEIDPAEMPRCQRQIFVELRKAMYQRIPLPEEAAPQASIRKMSIRQVATHTEQIIAIYSELLRIQSSTVVETEESDNVGPSVATTAEGALAQHLN